MKVAVTLLLCALVAMTATTAHFLWKFSCYKGSGNFGGDFGGNRGRGTGFGLEGIGGVCGGIRGCLGLGLGLFGSIGIGFLFGVIGSMGGNFWNSELCHGDLGLA